MEQTELVDGVRPGNKLVVHSLFNALGQGAPIPAAIVTVPLLVRLLGTERFGLLTLCWTVVGYASIFDLGLGRALTQLVAERNHVSDRDELASTVWSALAAMLLFGCLVCAAAVMAAPTIVSRWLSVSPSLAPEVTTAFRLLAIGIPVVVVTAGIRGILEAHERFDLVNAVRLPTGLSTFLGPLGISLISRTLTASVATLIAARAIGLVVQIVMIRRVAPDLVGRRRVTAAALGPVVRFGAWITVSNIVSPLMSSADRFFISGMISASVVAYYTAPYEMVTRLMAVTAVAVATSIFPAFARWRGAGEAQGLFSRGMTLTIAAFVPVILVIIAFADPILHLWLGAEFAHRSTSVLRVLGVGVILNGLAQMPFAHIQAIGRADLTAKVHLAEAPATLALLVYLIRARGIEGAAMAWTARMAVDALLLFLISRRLLKAGRVDAVALEGA